MLTEGYQQLIDLYPVFLGQLCFQSFQGLFGGFGLNIAPAVRDPMDMDIDANAGVIQGHPQGQVGAFRPYPLKLGEYLGVGGEFAAEVTENLQGNLANLSGLVVGEGGRLNQRLNFRDAQINHLSRGTGTGKETTADGDTHLVIGANRNDAGDELLIERVKPFLRGSSDDTVISFANQRSRLTNGHGSYQNL